MVFLDSLHDTINNPSFDASQDFFFNTGRKNRETLLALDYSMEDVLDNLKHLTIEEYSEALIDKDNNDPPILYVFGKLIDSRMVYIKIKLRKKSNTNDHLICISFHFAEQDMAFPFV